MLQQSGGSTKIRRCILLVLTIFILFGCLLQDGAGSVDYFLSLEPTTTVTEPPVILQSGTAGTSTIYTNSTSAKVNVATPGEPTYYPNEYSISTGTHVSGIVPTSVQNVDTDYFTVRSAASTNNTYTYNPSGFNLLDSTKLASGASSDLQSNDAAYMTFRSYVSASSSTAKTDAFVAYRDSTTSLNTSKERTWTGDTATWSSPSEMLTSDSPVRYTRVAYCPIEQRSFEKIVVTLSDDGYLDAYVWDGTAWNVTNDIGQVWSSAPSDARRSYDIAYESTYGEALLVYGTTVAGGSNDLAYRVWTFAAGWGSEQYYDDADHASKVTVTYVTLASDPNTDKIGMTYIENTNNNANAVIWSGSSWSNFVEITGTVAIATDECTAIACESISGAFMAVAGEGQFIKWARFTTSWSSVDIFDINSGATGNMDWLKLASSQNNRLMLTSVDASSDLCTAVWDTNSIGNRQWEMSIELEGFLTVSTYYSAIRFTAQASKSVTHVAVYILIPMAPPSYKFGIETSTSAYLPSGTYVGGASNFATATPSSTGWLNLTLPAPAPLTAGTVYHITVRYNSGTIGPSNFIALGRSGIYANFFRPNENTIDSWLNTIYYTTSASIQNRDPLFILRYNDNTYESMPYDTVTAHSIYGNNWFSEKWTQNGTQTILGVNILLTKSGTPPDNLYVILRNETSGQDVSTITITQGSITTPLQWYEQYFSSPIVLVNGATYRLILKSPSSTSSNYFSCRSLTTSKAGAYTYDGTNSFFSSSSNGGSSWTDAGTRDLTYIILLSNSGTNGWVIHPPWDTSVDTYAQRCADFAWEYRSAPDFRNQGLLVYGDGTSGVITWRRFRAPNYMTAVTSPPMAGGTHPWVQLKSNPRSVSGDVKILGIVLTNTTFDIGAISWDGTTFTVIGTDTISSDTTVITYECFELEFPLFGTPTEFTSEVEFTGSSNTESFNQLVWTADSSWTTGNVTVTLQLYNYTLGNYSTSGDGYISYTSSATENIDETKTQTITTNPTDFRNGTGYWRIKVKGVKSTSTQFDFKADWIEFKSAYTVFTVSTQFLISSMTTNTPTQLNFTVVSQYNITGVTIKIQVWNYSSSTYVTSGEGYTTYISAGANETKLLNITTNPQFYTSSGNARINVTGTLATVSAYQQEVNQVKLVYEYGSITHDYVLKINNTVTDAWKINLKVYSDSNISRLSSAIIRFHDGISSDQIIISGGVVTQSEGPQYDLPGNSTRYISIVNLNADTSGTSHLYVYLKILVPNTSTYSLFIITFEIT